MFSFFLFREKAKKLIQARTTDFLHTWTCMFTWIIQFGWYSGCDGFARRRKKERKKRTEKKKRKAFQHSNVKSSMKWVDHHVMSHRMRAIQFSRDADLFDCTTRTRSSLKFQLKMTLFETCFVKNKNVWIQTIWFLFVEQCLCILKKLRWILKVLCRLI